MLTMEFIGMPQVIQLHKIKPQQEKPKRITSVQAFFDSGEGQQVLRYTSLVFQLTGRVEALAASKPKDGEPPRVVSFCNEQGHLIVEDSLRRLLKVLPVDPALEIGPATSILLGTALDLILRLDQVKNTHSRCAACARSGSQSSTYTI